MEVTSMCLECHEDAAKEVMATTHWTWEKMQSVPGKGNVVHGKKNAINNFCVSVGSNEARCTSCHVGYGWKDDSFDFEDESRTDSHYIPGQSLLVSATAGATTLDCTDCHGDSPHCYFPTASKYNAHSKRIACQTCHIAHYAKADGTEMSWDWSKAETDKAVAKDKKEIKEHGHKVYIYKKGLFTYEDNVVPTYAWFNGSAGGYMIGDKMDPKKVTVLNQPFGDKDDPTAKIRPFKVHTGKQTYDTKFSYLITPNVWGPKGDPDAFWQQFDWNKAAIAGMKASGLEYSGEYDFAPTSSYWPINHQVDPKTKALKCLDCHKSGKRMNWKQLGYAGDPMLKK